MSGALTDGDDFLYPIGRECVWSIDPVGDAQVSLQFTSFNTNFNHTQEPDEVHVYDGPDTSAPLLRTLTSMPVSPIISSHGSLCVALTSHGNFGTGIEASFDSVSRCNPFSLFEFCFPHVSWLWSHNLSDRVV